jgi:hypothetical protein
MIGRSASKIPVFNIPARARATLWRLTESPPLMGENCGHGPREDPEIHPQRPLVDVSQIKLCPLVEVIVHSRLYLPESGNPRAHRKSPAVPNVVALDFPRGGWARTDQTHISRQDIDQLR